MTDPNQTAELVRLTPTQQRRARADDIAFARSLDRHTVMHNSHIWPRISELHRAGLVKVTVLNKFLAEIDAAGEAVDVRSG